MAYKPLFTGLGIIGGYLAAILGLSFYVRRRIGPRLWRKAHQLTIVVYALAVVHTLGAGTDAGDALAALVDRDHGARRSWCSSSPASGRRCEASRAAAAASAARPELADPAASPRRGGLVNGGDGVLIVGGGLAGQRCAETLRARGYERPIRIVCAEPLPPYDRPPLSKGLLAGEAPDHSVGPAARMLVRGEPRRAAARARAPRASTPRRARGDARRRRARSATRSSSIATGSRARELRFLDGHSNVHALRTLADVRRLRGELRPGAKLVLSARASSASRRRPPRAASGST